MFFIAVFVGGLILAAQDAYGDPTIAVGKAHLSSDQSYGEIGYITKQNWEFNLGLIGAGETKYGYQDVGITYGASKIIKPNWCFLGGCNYWRIGVSGVHNSPLVGPVNYRLGIGMDYGVFAVEAVHMSSAGIFEDNTGFDAVVLKMELPW